MSRPLRAARIGIFLSALSCAAPVFASDPWWKHAVIYEVYPRSFQDSNGDGVGDLNGISQRLDYLQSLGVDAIWLAPIYPSPQVDFGYDISDYAAVDPQYGTLADFDRLVANAKKRGIRIILDMVLNHTSDQHPWFKAAASSRTDPRHDWYVWSDGRSGGAAGRAPPNNWISLFGGSSWQYVPAVDQFYYHKFYRQQPDLNWRNPAVERAMFAAMRFWLDRGVGGFRLDAITTLFEDPLLRDEPRLAGTTAQGDPNLDHIYTGNLPEVHDVLRRMRAMVDRYPGDRVLIGETYLTSTQAMDQWYGGARHDELQLAMDMLVGLINRLDAQRFRDRLEEVETQIHGSEPLLVFDNHDNARSWDRYGDGRHDLAIAKLMAAILLASRDSALLYQGEELGQPTSVPTRIEDVRDPIGRSGWPREKGRDGERTPMQWDDSRPSAGFSTNAATWLPIQAGYRQINVRTELSDPQSLLNWHRQLIVLRRSLPALQRGDMRMLESPQKGILAFVRVASGEPKVLVCLNLGGSPARLHFNPRELGVERSRVQTLLTDAPSLQGPISLSEIALPAYASWIALLP